MFNVLQNWNLTFRSIFMIYVTWILSNIAFKDFPFFIHRLTLILYIDCRIPDYGVFPIVFNHSETQAYMCFFDKKKNNN